MRLVIIARLLHQPKAHFGLLLPRLLSLIVRLANVVVFLATSKEVAAGINVAESLATSKEVSTRFADVARSHAMSREVSRRILSRANLFAERGRISRDEQRGVHDNT